MMQNGGIARARRFAQPLTAGIAEVLCSRWQFGTSRVVLVLFCSVIFLVPVSVGVARASENTLAAAQLSWSATSDVTSLSAPGGSAALHLRLRGLTSFKGAEIAIRWAPASDIPSTCLVLEGAAFRTGAGATCTYLNRGVALPVVTRDDSTGYAVSWANSDAFTSCASGDAVQLTFDLTGCQALNGASFALCQVTILDRFNGLRSVAPESLGSAVTLGAGESVPPCSPPPVLAALGDTTLTPGQTLIYNPLSASGNGALAVRGHEGDVTASELTVSGANLPPGAVLDTTSAVLTWTPTTSEVGSWNGITISVSSGNGASASTSFNAQVASPNQPPVLTVLPDTTVGACQLVVLQPVAVDPEGDSLRWSATGLPPGATIDSLTGQIEWKSGLDPVTWTAQLFVEQPGTGGSGCGGGVTVVVDPTPFPFGVFQAQLAQEDHTALQGLRPGWVHRTVFPLERGIDWDTDFLGYVHDFIDTTVVNAQALGLEIVLDVSTHWDATDSTLKAYWPPRGTEASKQEWTNKINYLARRYNIGEQDTLVRMPGLKQSVIYWHVEEELSFIPDPTAYIEELSMTRTAIRQGNPDARIILVGLTSDPVWWQACGGATGSGTTCQRPPLVEWDETKYTQFQQATTVLFSHPDLYEILDLHVYARTFNIRGLAQWVRDASSGVNSQNASRDLWILEAGGPFLDDTNGESYAGFTYTQISHSQFTYAIAAEALTNGVKRIAFELFPGGRDNNDHSRQYKNVALLERVVNPDSTVIVNMKPAYFALQRMSGVIGETDEAVDLRVPLTPTSSCSELDALFQAAFPHTVGDRKQESVMWFGRSNVTHSATLYLDQPSNPPTWVFVYPTPINNISGAGTFPVDEATPYDSVVIELRSTTLNPLPFMIQASAPFTLHRLSALNPASIDLNVTESPRVTWTTVAGKSYIGWNLPANPARTEILLVDVLGRIVGAHPVRTRQGTVAFAELGRGVARGVYLAALRSDRKVVAVSRGVVTR